MYVPPKIAQVMVFFSLPNEKSWPDAGHLIHMPTHIDVLVGDYESCVEYNLSAIVADEKIMRTSPDTAGT